MLEKNKKTLESVAVKKTATRDVELILDVNSDNLDIPLNQNFFYEISQSKKHIDFIYRESGVGKFYKKQNKFFFSRNYVFDVRKDGGKYKPVNGNAPDIEESDCDIILSNIPPTRYINTFFAKHSVLCSTDPFTPTSVELQNNTLLGKLDDIIQSIDQNELWSILLQNNKKPVEGSIRYNKKQKCFQGYDGKQWRTLMWGDE
jgi:hypothetical protein